MLVTMFTVLFAVFSKEISESIVHSIYVCIEIIIPSMFAYMVISSYILSSSIHKTLFSPLYFLLNKIIRLDKQLFSVFSLSLIGGYPVGIKLLKEIIAQNKSYSAIIEKAAAFCYCISPTFAITMIGLGLYNSIEAGIIVYISNVIANIIMATVYSRIYKLEIPDNPQKQNSGLIQAINSSSAALLRICAVIVIFNAGIAAVEALVNTVGIIIPVYIKSFTEISNILNFSKPGINLLPLISAIASTGGLCVIFQCYSIAQNSFSFKNFLIARIPTALLSGLITNILLQFWNINLPSSSVGGQYSFQFNTNKAVVVFLLIMCTILLQKNEKIFKKG